MSQIASGTGQSWYARNEFMIRRLHSLSGLIPVGAYMVVHLVANASILNGVESFQNVVYQIHALGNLLPVVEWVFIFLPILFHALLGFVFIFGGRSNLAHYPTASNWRYVLQRVSGMVAFLFILWHVLQLNGLIHAQWFRESVADPMGLAQFRPYNAASTAARALQNPVVIGCYLIGILACVFHFANGIWTMGITWGVWVTPRAQAGASRICLGIGSLLAVVALGAVFGFLRVDADSAERRENEMYEQRVDSGMIPADEHKISKPHHQP